MLKNKFTNMHALPTIVDLFISMKVMVMFNVATVHDIVNGTCADVIDIILDEREPHVNPTGSIVMLHYPPKYILLQFGDGMVCHLPGLPDNVWPLEPMKKTFTISDGTGNSKKITCQQLLLLCMC